MFYRIVGSRQHNRQPRLSDEVHDIIMEKSAATKHSDNTERRRLQNVYKQLARRDRDAFLNRIASKAEEDASKGKIGAVF